ncbi:MAG: helix-hairpin-helix domain-containing protein [Gammaproteobacteria bacterium]|nr:helix-hairpin-helix domain-containing protein [Gammaproteobacteria bacterium]
MTTELTKIAGIAERTAEFLKENGYPSVESIANSTIENLAKVRGFSVSRAEKVIQQASVILSAEPPSAQNVINKTGAKTTTKTTSKEKSKSDKTNKKEKKKDKKKVKTKDPKDKDGGKKSKKDKDKKKDKKKSGDKKTKKSKGKKKGKK